MRHTMDKKYDILFVCVFLTLFTDCVFSQTVNGTRCVTNNWHKKWKSCYMKHCGSDPGICITSRGTPVCRRVKDNCGMCVKRWFVDNQVVECERTTVNRECPPNIILRNCPRNLCDNVCPDSRFSGAPCRVNRCGDCTPEYSVDGLWMMCPSEPFSSISSNNDLTGLRFFHPGIDGAVMTGNAVPTPSNSATNRNFGGVPEVARAVATSNSFRSAGPGDVPEQSRCSNGIPESICPDLCSNAQCDNYPEAVCRVNTCGPCRAEFFIGEDRVNCQGQKCAPGVTYFHTCNSCSYNYCHNYPTATCRMDACGKCKATYWLNGNKEVKCVEQNILDTCPDNTDRWMCEKSPCHFDTCPMNSSISCITDNCGGCRPMYVHKLTKEVVQCRGYWTRFEGRGANRGHIATQAEKRRARAERDRQQRNSRVVSENTNPRIREPVNRVGSVPDIQSSPGIRSQIRPAGRGQNRNQQGGFIDAMAELGRGQSDSNFDLSLSRQERPGTSGSSNNQDLGSFADLLREAEAPFGALNPSSSSSNRLREFGGRQPSSESSRPTGRQFSDRQPARNNPTVGQRSRSQWSTNNGPQSDVITGSNRRRPGSSGSSSPAQNAQRIVPVVTNGLSEPVGVRSEQVPVSNVGSGSSSPVVQQAVLNPGIPFQPQSVPVQPLQDNRQERTQVVGEIDKIIANLDTALRKAHPPLDRSPSAANRPLGHQPQPKPKGSLLGESLGSKPVIALGKKRPSKTLSAEKNAKIPLTLHKPKNPSLHKSKSKSTNKPNQTKPRRNPDRTVKSAKRKAAAAAAAAAKKKGKSPTKPEQKKVPFQSLMFPAEFLNFFKTLGNGNGFAIPNQMLDTTTRRS